VTGGLSLWLDVAPIL